MKENHIARFGVARTRAALTTICLLSVILCSCNTETERSSTKQRWELRSAVVVMRHGIRAPTDSALIAQVAAGVPAPWSAPDGHITEHGKALIKQMGHYVGAWFKAEGVLPTHRCPLGSEIILYGNTKNRMRDSAHSFAHGFAGGCDLPFRSQPFEGGDDPLFRGTTHCPIDNARARDSLIHALSATTLETAIADFRLTHQAALTTLATLSRAPIIAAPTRYRAWADSYKPDELGSPKSWEDYFKIEKSLASTLVFEHADGVPEAALAWGNALSDESRQQLARFADDYHSRLVATPYLAKRNGTYLMRTILGVLAQQRDLDTPLAWKNAPRNRAVFFVGHEISLAPLFALLQIDWHHPLQASHTPAGGSLVFARWRDRLSQKDYVRLEFIAQTDQQMREMSPLSLAHPPLHLTIPVPACLASEQNNMCEMSSFISLMNARLAADCPESTSLEALAQAPAR